MDRVDLSFLRWIGGRLAFTLVVLLLLSVAIFLITEVFPGDVVARIYQQPIPENVKEALRIRLAVNEPGWLKYWHWLFGVFTLDLGRSVWSQQPIAPLIGSALTRSLLLGGIASALIVPVSVFLGALAAVRSGKWIDRVISAVSFAGFSVPEFVLGNVLVWIFAVVIPAFPALFIDVPDAPFLEQARSFVLPVLTLTPVTAAYMIRTMRSSMSSVLAEPFVEMGLLKGLTRKRIILRHALPNALVAMVNVFALNIGWLVGGIVIVEILFQYPGIGRLLLDSIRSQDVPVIQDAALAIGAIYVLLNFVADITLFALDPRIRRRLT